MSQLEWDDDMALSIARQPWSLTKPIFPQPYFWLRSISPNAHHAHIRTGHGSIAIGMDVSCKVPMGRGIHVGIFSR